MRKVSLAVLLCLATVAMPAMAGQGAAPSSPAAVTQPATAPASPLPRVRLVATGGTISNRRGGRLTADEIVASVPGMADVAAVDAEQFANVASAQITLDQWLALARRLNAIFRDDPSLSGIVVTSGTDTLEELAYFLHLTVRDRRPVVVTGSMRNPSQVGYEGPANLLASVRVAADARAAGRGVLVVLNDEINGARDVTKTDALRLQHVRSRELRCARRGGCRPGRVPPDGRRPPHRGIRVRRRHDRDAAARGCVPRLSGRARRPDQGRHRPRRARRRARDGRRRCARRAHRIRASRTRARRACPSWPPHARAVDASPAAARSLRAAATGQARSVARRSVGGEGARAADARA